MASSLEFRQLRAPSCQRSNTRRNLNNHKLSSPTPTSTHMTHGKMRWTNHRRLPQHSRPPNNNHHPTYLNKDTVLNLMYYLMVKTHDYHNTFKQCMDRLPLSLEQANSIHQQWILGTSLPGAMLHLDHYYHQTNGATMLWDSPGECAPNALSHQAPAKPLPVRATMLTPTASTKKPCQRRPLMQQPQGRHPRRTPLNLQKSQLTKTRSKTSPTTKTTMMMTGRATPPTAKGKPRTTSPSPPHQPRGGRPPKERQDMGPNAWPTRPKNQMSRKDGESWNGGTNQSG